MSAAMVVAAVAVVFETLRPLWIDVRCAVSVAAGAIDGGKVERAELKLRNGGSI